MSWVSIRNSSLECHYCGHSETFQIGRVAPFMFEHEKCKNSFVDINGKPNRIVKKQKIGSGKYVYQNDMGRKEWVPAIPVIVVSEK